MSRQLSDWLVVKDASCQQGAFELRADFAVAEPGVTAVFGPSGAGKSSLLKLIAGLGRLDRGSISLRGELIEDIASRVRIPAHRRDIGLVFQDARLFPHLTVEGNLRFAQKRAPEGAGALRLEDVASEVEVDHLLDRPVGRLSGGERSRVALARALLSAPRFLLLDEPFAALDGRLRRAFIEMLGRIARERDLPMMVVTHLIDDAVELADTALAMRDGAVIAHGAAGEVFAGEAFRGLLDRRDLGVRLAPGVLGHDGERSGGKGLWLRADNVLVAVEAPRGLSARNVWAGRLTAITEETGGSVLLSMQCEFGEVLARVTKEAVGDLGLSVGQDIWAVVKTHAV